MSTLFLAAALASSPVFAQSAPGSASSAYSAPSAPSAPVPTPAVSAVASSSTAVVGGVLGGVAGTAAMAATLFATENRDCSQGLTCEGYGQAVLAVSVLHGGGAGFGLGAASAGALGHHLVTHRNAGRVLLVGGVTSLASSGLAIAGHAALSGGQEGPGAGLMVAGLVGNLVGVPLAVGLVSAGDARRARGNDLALSAGEAPALSACEAPALALTSVGIAPVEGGARLGVGLAF